METMTLKPQGRAFITVCIDPADAAEYGERAYVDATDIEVTAAQWEFVEGILTEYAAAGMRLTAAYNDGEPGTWRFHFTHAKRAGGFSTLMAYEVTADGKATFWTEAAR